MLWSRFPFGISAGSSPAPVSRSGRNCASKFRPVEHSFLLAPQRRTAFGDDRWRGRGRRADARRRCWCLSRYGGCGRRSRLGPARPAATLAVARVLLFVPPCGAAGHWSRASWSRLAAHPRLTWERCGQGSTVTIASEDGSTALGTFLPIGAANGIVQLRRNRPFAEPPMPSPLVELLHNRWRWSQRTTRGGHS